MKILLFVFALLSFYNSYSQQAQKNKLIIKGNKTNGAYLVYTGNGKKIIESYYKNGKPDSLYLELKTNGDTLFYGHYINGKKQGVWREPPKNSYFLDESRPTFNLATYKNGQIISANYIFIYDLGEKEQVLTTYGKKIIEKRFLWFNNGQLNSEEYRINGREDSTSKVWNRQGVQIIFAHYKNGHLIGKKTDWRDDGTLEEERFYNNAGVLILDKKYDESGKLILEREYNTKQKIIRN